jgi:Tfp pilus assembly protein PilO
VNPRLRIIIAVAALIAIPSLTWVLVVAPLHAQAASNTNLLAEADAANSQHTSQIDTLQAASKRLAVLQAQVATLDAALPENASMGTLLAEIGTLAANDGVTVTGFTNTPVASTASATTPAAAATPAASSSATTTTTTTTTTGGLTAIAVTVQVQGSRSSVQKFIGALQTASRLISINSIAMTADAAGGFDATIAGNAYTLAGSN